MNKKAIITALLALVAMAGQAQKIKMNEPSFSDYLPLLNAKGYMACNCWSARASQPDGWVSWSAELQHLFDNDPMAKMDVKILKRSNFVRFAQKGLKKAKSGKMRVKL